MKITGKSLKIGDNINTDFIISGRYKFAITDIKELAKHLMEDIEPEFPSKIVPGRTILVAGANFGMGSSREQAPLVIKEAGINAVIAKQFARIFFRNAFNIGLPVLEADTDKIAEYDELDIDLDRGVIKNLTKKIELNARPVPPFMQQIVNEGGIVSYFRRHGRLPAI